jgi:pyrroloquinoline quinone biosynthesis protein D
MESESVPRRRSRLMAEEMDGECLLYRRGKHQAVYLNETATVIWKLCDGTRTVAEIVDLLAEKYPESREQIGADVSEALDLLVQQGIIALGQAGPRHHP